MRNPTSIAAVVDSGMSLIKLIALNRKYCQHSSRKILEIFSLIDSPNELSAYVDSLLGKRDLHEAAKQRELALKHSVQILSLLDVGYPRRLRSIPDPPLVVFVRGNVELLAMESESYSVVGSRRASSYGIRIAEKLGEYLQRNRITTVSGLALGVDAASHWGVLKGVGKSREVAKGIAVLGSGVLHISPVTNQELGEKLLAAGGTIISEYGLETRPQKHFYPRRNRIICGLSSRLLVVEAAQRSGTLVSARLALEQGRDVLVVPGSILSEAALGSNRLLMEGAEPLISFEQLVDEERRLASTSDTRGALGQPSLNSLDLNTAESVILEALRLEDRSFLQLTESLDLTAAEIRLSLASLEVEELIGEHRGIFSIS